jgi:alkylation response protein AidB-like acyl-CoA dehydrogenase
MSRSCSLDLMAFDLSLTDDQLAVDDLFANFLTDRCPPSVVRAAEPLGFDPDLWRAIAAVGAPGMSAPVEVGGGGASLSEVVVAAERVGRAAAPVPFAEHLAATRLVHDSDVVAGDAVATVALRPAVDGAWELVPAGAVAAVVIGVDGDELVAVRSEPPMSGPLNLAAAPIANRSAQDGERTVIGPAGALSEVFDEWRLHTAAMLVGVAAEAMDMAVAYVRERHQFGKPIGAFQAVQHGLADLPGHIDGARLLVHKAAWAADRPLPGGIDVDHNDVTDAAALAAMAFVFATDVAAMATDRSLHYHGGYGFAEEYDIQLYYRRARGWPLVAGDPGAEARRLADLLFGADVAAMSGAER